jgi:hypothetical protein
MSSDFEPSVVKPTRRKEEMIELVGRGLQNSVIAYELNRIHAGRFRLLLMIGCVGNGGSGSFARAAQRRAGDGHRSIRSKPLSGHAPAPNRGEIAIGKI